MTSFQVLSFGDGADGRLGLGDERPLTTPKVIQGFTDKGERVVEVSCGQRSSIILSLES